MTAQERDQQEQERQERLRKIEEQVIMPESQRGRYAWPVEVTVLGQTARLRLESGKSRILFDWSSIPDDWVLNLESQGHSVAKAGRVKHLVPGPETPVSRAQDRGHNPELAIEWARDYLRDLVRIGEYGAAGTNGNGGAPGRRGPTTADIVAEWQRSSDYKGVSQDTQTQQDKWMSFLTQVFPGRSFRVKRTTAHVENEIVNAFQQPWERLLSDGTRVDGHRGRDVGHNTAVKVAEHYRRMVMHALTVDIGVDDEGEPIFLLERDPYRRIRERDLPQQSETKKRPKGKASDEFADEFERGLAGQNPQARPIGAIVRRTGRRIGEPRLLRRCDYLKSVEEIEGGLYRMQCRDSYGDLHVRQEDIPEVARMYVEGGGALFMSMDNVKQVNQARARGDDSFDEKRFDVVIPIGPNLARIIDDYLEAYWEDLGLPDDAPLFPAERASRDGGSEQYERATPKSTVEGWTKTAKQLAAEVLGKNRVPSVGKAHPLRKRVRSILKDAKAYGDTVGFYAAWSGRDLAELDMDHVYAHVTPQEILALIPVLDDPDPVTDD